MGRDRERPLMYWYDFHPVILKNDKKHLKRIEEQATIQTSTKVCYPYANGLFAFHSRAAK